MIIETVWKRAIRKYLLEFKDLEIVWGSSPSDFRSHNHNADRREVLDGLCIGSGLSYAGSPQSSVEQIVNTTTSKRAEDLGMSGFCIKANSSWPTRA